MSAKGPLPHSGVQHPLAGAGRTRVRRATALRQPGATPAEIVTKLEKHYLAAVMASGAAVGSAAAFPGIGTLTALSAVAGETMLFLEATAAFVLAVADVHGIPVEDRERRRTLVLAALVGDAGKGAVKDLLGPGRTSGAWLAEAELLPLPVVSQPTPDSCSTSSRSTRSNGPPWPSARCCRWASVPRSAVAATG